MSARAMWKGTLSVGSHEVPVKLYSAVEDHSVHFHLLDKRTKRRVQQAMVDPESEREVEHKEVRRGFEVEPGTFVVLDDEELASLEPESSREIDVVTFLPAGAIHHQWYERPYYLSPDGDAASYYALAQALARKDKEGLARWVMRKKRYFGALRSEGDYLVLITMRNAGEVLLPKELPRPGGRSASSREVRIARQLISMLEGPFDPAEFRDEYNDRLLGFLRSRARGRRPKLAVVRRRREGGSLEDDLARSLESMKERDEKKGDKKVERKAA